LSLASVWSCSGEADFSDSMPEPVILIAEDYQNEIVEIDRLVFEDGPFDAARKAALSSKFDALAARIKTSSDSKFIFIEGLEFKRLAAAMRNLHPKAPRSLIENDWMRLRSNVFDDRSWFARSAADLEAIAETEAPLEPAEAETASEQEEASFAQPKIVKRASLNELDGRWAVTEIHGNGRPMNDQEMSGSIWVFGEELLSVQHPSGTETRYTVRKVIDERGSALRMESIGAVYAENGWMIYKFEEGDLTLAFFDGLGGRPDGFTPPVGSGERMLVVVKLSAVE